MIVALHTNTNLVHQTNCRGNMWFIALQMMHNWSGLRRIREWSHHGSALSQGVTLHVGSETDSHLCWVSVHLIVELNGLWEVFKLLSVTVCVCFQHFKWLSWAESMGVASCCTKAWDSFFLSVYCLLLCWMTISDLHLIQLHCCWGENYSYASDLMYLSEIKAAMLDYHGWKSCNLLISLDSLALECMLSICFSGWTSQTLCPITSPRGNSMGTCAHCASANTAQGKTSKLFH